MAIFVLIGDLSRENIDNAPPFLFGTILSAIFGASFGVAHWLFLRRYLSGIAAWILATFIAFIVGATIVFGLLDESNPESPPVIILIDGVVFGFTFGWIVLRDKPVHRAYLWVLCSLGGWIIAELTGIALANLIEPPLDLVGLFLIGASLPGLGMVWLLRQTSPAEPAKVIVAEI